MANLKNQDKTRHGSLEFPMEIYQEYVENNNINHIFWHWHNSIQFCLLKKGAVCFHINNDALEMKTGDILFINSGVLHNVINQDNVVSYYSCYNIEPELLYTYPGNIINTKYFYPIIEDDKVDYCLIRQNDIFYQEIYENLIAIYNYFQVKDELKIYISLLSVWDILYHHYFKFSNHYDNERIKQVISYVENHYDEKLTLENIANEVGVSKNYLCRDFKKRVRCSIFDYITNYRILKSLELLKKDLTITEISYQCGFNSPSFFIKKFKEKMNMAPNKYRQLNRKK
ncbi:MAG: AraC family transcriptional regulator [Thomasclavelia sp.]